MPVFVSIDELTVSGVYNLVLYAPGADTTRVELVSITDGEYVFKDINDPNHFIGTNSGSYYDTWGCRL